MERDVTRNLPHVEKPTLTASPTDVNVLLDMRDLMMNVYLKIHSHCCTDVVCRVLHVQMLTVNVVHTDASAKLDSQRKVLWESMVYSVMQLLQNQKLSLQQ